MLKPSLVLAYFGVLPTNVDCWEGPADGKGPLAPVCGGVDDGLVELLIVVRHPLEYRGQRLDESSMRKGKRV